MRLCQAASGFWDLPAQIVDYGRSALTDVPAVQSETVQRHAANPVRRGAGPAEGAGRKVSWRISRQSVATRGGQLPL